jgi:diguanylate cyclase (GGDEF)-like protein
MQGASRFTRSPRAWREWLCLLLLVLIPVGLATAQDKPLSAYFRETWTTRQGLPHNQINAMAQSPDGYLWLGTWEGLVRYNGLEFHVFDRGNTPELKDNGVRSVTTTADGAVVVGTSRGGVSILRGDHWRTWLMKDGLSQDEVMNALVDKQQRLWVATESAGVTRIDIDNAKGKPTYFNKANGFPSDITYGLLLDRDGSVWVATAAGLAHFIGDRPVVYASAAGLPDAPIFSVVQDAAGTVFVGTERGVFRRTGERFRPQSPDLPVDGVPSLAVDSSGNLWVGTVNNGLLRQRGASLERFTSLRGLPNNRVASLLVDREGSIWAGTNAGLLRLSDAPFSTFNRDQGLSDDYVRALAESRDGSIWIGTSRGLNQWRNGKLKAGYTSADGLPSDSILSLLEDRDGSLLVGTYTAGVIRLRDGKVVAQFDRAHGMPASNQIRALAQQPDGTVWIGTNRGLARMRDGKFTYFGTEQGLPRDFIISLKVARDGSLWVGTANGAAHIVGDKVTKLDLRGMNGAQDIFDFHEDADRTLWIASDRGLVRYRNGSLKVIGLKQGLPVDTLFEVIDDGRGSFWLTSNRGVLRITRTDAGAVLSGIKATLTVDHFGEADGLASSQCNGGAGPAALRDALGRIWVATAAGAAVVDPSKLDGYRRELPPVVIEEVLANDKQASIKSPLRLPAGTSKLEFHFASLSFKFPRLIRYRYRLDGLEHQWNERGNQRVAQYTNLRPGRYRFLVNASLPGLGMGWSKDTTVVDIEIKPMFWQQPWFLPLLLVLAALLVAGIYRWRLGHLRQRSVELEALIEQRTRDLRDRTDRLMESDKEKTVLLGKLRQHAEAFERQAREDALTGLANRRSMDEELARGFAESVATGRRLSVALFDIDEFKRINDSYSHAAGDEALIAVAHAMREELGGLGMLARWGGEEFALLFEDMQLEEARHLCERLRRAVEHLDCIAFAPGWKLTISGGVAERTGLSHYEKLLSRADLLLYEAKRAGRNRIHG